MRVAVYCERLLLLSIFQLVNLKSEQNEARNTELDEDRETKEGRT
jgi:hypothetical protein